MAKDPNELGALWLKQGRKGEYMTGTINGVPVVVFPNSKTNENQPDWRVLRSVPQGERQGRQEPRSFGPDDDDGIPF